MGAELYGREEHRPGECGGEQQDDPFQHPGAPPLQPDEVIEQALDALDAIPGEGAVQQARQLRQHRRPARRLVAEGAQEALQSDLLAHPILEKRLGGGPQVEVGVELSPEPLDVEQRLLQHDELRLDLDVEAARDLEQAHERAAKGDFLQRPVEERLAHGANRAFELVHSRIGGHPARLQVRPRDAGVVALEKPQEVLREILLVHLGERAHDAEIERDVAALRRHQDVSRVHVGVEEAVAEHLREEDLDAGACELRNVHALPAQLFDFAHRRAAHPLHGHDGARAEVPIHLRHREQRRVQEVAAQLACMRRLAHQVQLLGQMSRELCDYFVRPQALAVGPEALDEARGGVHQCEILAITGVIRGRRILTAASVPPGSTARCTCATDALATGCSSNFSKIFAIDLPKARSTSATASSPGNGGTRSWSIASSSARSAGKRSRRVENTWPNLTKMGPSASSARRSRTARGSESARKKRSAFSARASRLPDASANSSSPKRRAIRRILARRNKEVGDRGAKGPIYQNWPT